ncbi:hypothetical protein LTS15_005529, partial [Exophiala xenobiotica]
DESTRRLTDEEHSNLAKAHELRSIRIRLMPPSGRVICPKVAQDTCAGRNLITKTLAVKLGLEILPDLERLVFETIEKGKVEAQGVVSIPIETSCCGMKLEAKFYVLEELAKHQILLGIGLILKLGHLEKKLCGNHPGAAN